MYSRFCSALAASGKVVLALEHRDGTGLACMPRSWNGDAKASQRTVVYLREEDTWWVPHLISYLLPGLISQLSAGTTINHQGEQCLSGGNNSRSVITRSIPRMKHFENMSNAIRR